MPGAAQADGKTNEGTDLAAFTSAAPAAEPASSKQQASPAPAAQGSGMWEATSAPRGNELAPGESMFLEDGQMSAVLLRKEMLGDRWDDTVARFEADAITDRDARELQTMYERALHKSLTKHGLVLARFGCGLSLCAGTVRGPKKGGQSRIESWWGADPVGDLPMPMRVVTKIDNPRYAENRFSFSTDPSIRTILVSH